MEKKRVLVTGASGYIGRHVVAELLNMGHDVLASDLRFDGVDQRAQQIDTSIFCGEKNIYELLGSPDVLVHLAWRDGFRHNSDAHMTDLSKHYEFIRNMLDGGLKCISVMGSMHEVGYWEGAIDENTPTRPLSMYGIAKNSLREATELLAKETGAVYHWLRGFYIFGDDLKNNSIFSRLVKMEMDGEEFLPFTSGKNKYDFIEIDSLAAQIAAASVQDEVVGIINCCSGKPVSLADKVEEFIRKNNFKIKLKYGEFPDRPYDSPAVWGDNSRINEIMRRLEEKK